jgi:hypothetical protein
MVLATASISVGVGDDSNPSLKYLRNCLYNFFTGGRVSDNTNRACCLKYIFEDMPLIRFVRMGTIAKVVPSLLRPITTVSVSGRSFHSEVAFSLFNIEIHPPRSSAPSAIGVVVVVVDDNNVPNDDDDDDDDADDEDDPNNPDDKFVADFFVDDLTLANSERSKLNGVDDDVSLD